MLALTQTLAERGADWCKVLPVCILLREGCAEVSAAPDTAVHSAVEAVAEPTATAPVSTVALNL